MQAVSTLGKNTLLALGTPVPPTQKEKEQAASSRLAEVVRDLRNIQGYECNDVKTAKHNYPGFMRSGDCVGPALSRLGNVIRQYAPELTNCESVDHAAMAIVLDPVKTDLQVGIAAVECLPSSAEMNAMDASAEAAQARAGISANEDVIMELAWSVAKVHAGRQHMTEALLRILSFVHDPDGTRYAGDVIRYANAQRAINKHATKAGLARSELGGRSEVTRTS